MTAVLNPWSLIGLIDSGSYLMGLVQPLVIFPLARFEPRTSHYQMTTRPHNLYSSTLIPCLSYLFLLKKVSPSSIIFDVLSDRKLLLCPGVILEPCLFVYFLDKKLLSLKMIVYEILADWKTNSHLEL